MVIEAKKIDKIPEYKTAFIKGCVRQCDVECSKYGIPDPTTCRCTCTPGFNMSEAGVCKPKCDKMCPANSKLDLNACKCVCNTGYSLVKLCDQEYCKPNCDKKCPIFSSLNSLDKCECICDEGYKRVSGGCEPICDISCPRFSTLDPRTCKCVSNHSFKFTKFY